MSSVLQLVLYVLFQTVLFAWSASGHAVSVRAELTHIDSAHGHRLTKRDLLRRMAARTRSRVEKRWSPARTRGTMATASASREEDDVNAEYLIHFGVGTPRPQPVALALDTSSDLVWTQCDCTVCSDQPLPVLDSSASATQRGVSCFDPVCARGGLPFSGCTLKDKQCFYAHSYPGGNTVTTGKIHEDTFTFQAPGGEEAVAVPRLRFGCGMYNKGKFESKESGVAGFGRGAMSLPSQLKVGRFSHCFTTIGSRSSSPVFLGTRPANLEEQATGPFQSTPFVHVPNSSRYYLSLSGVTVGKTPLPFDQSTFALRGDGSGGTTIDSGVGVTTFPPAVYRALRAEFAKQVPLNYWNNPDALCFLFISNSTSKKPPAMPKLILNLEGADWELPEKNYVWRFDAGTPGGTWICVVVEASPADSGDITVIGNFQQQNMHMEYDLDSNKLNFVRARCDKL